MNYPDTVQIETTTSCNASCGFCPHSSMKASGRMTDALMGGIIDQISGWEVAPAQICPFLTNEPFMDPRMFDYCAVINERLPRTNLAFFTNASLLTENKIEQLLALRNVAGVHCSLHHVNSSDYEQELGISFPRTIHAIESLLAAEPYFPVSILRVSNGVPANDEAFCRFCETRFPTAKWYVSTRWNWKGEIPSTYEAFLDIRCPRRGSLCITASGKVALCCMDQNADYAIGDANTESLLDIYNGQAWHSYYDKLKREVSPCNRCNMR